MSETQGFEKAITELEQITARLESGELSLEESIALFEKGVKLSTECRATLENARQKILSITDTKEEQTGDV